MLEQDQYGAFSDSRWTRAQDGIVLSIQEAVSSIWKPPTLVPYFTDHGPGHTLRILGKIVTLLDWYPSVGLSPDETYVLVLACWLHDVGMQCDVQKFPEVMRKAVQLGASFPQPFTATSTSDFSDTEQESIRKNHHFLSAAWIDVAYESPDSPLGPGIAQVDYTLVDDIRDLCLFHSSLPIGDCPQRFAVLTTGRKRLLAALLRMADELDIDKSRVDFTKLRSMRLRAANSIFWWLHHLTHVDTATRGIVRLEVLLNPMDADLLRNIETTYGDHFVFKNREVVHVLATHGLPLILEHEVRTFEKAQRLPLEVRTLLSSSPTGDPCAPLDSTLRSWLSSMHYEVGDMEPDGTGCFWLLATVSQGNLAQKIRILCTAREAVDEDVAALSARAQREGTSAWLVAHMRVADSARLSARDYPNLEVFTLSELLAGFWGAYEDALQARAREARLDDYYVSLTCQRESASGATSSRGIEEVVGEWKSELASGSLAILGEFGAGKSWFCLKYAMTQMAEFKKDPLNERFPVLIPLSQFRQAPSIQQMINHVLTEQYRLPFIGSAYKTLERLVDDGRILLLLDGLDEMTVSVDSERTHSNLSELARLGGRRAKTVITSRTEFFRDLVEEAGLLSPGLSRLEYDNLDARGVRPFVCERLHIEMLENGQIQEMLCKRVGTERGLEVWAMVFRDAGLMGASRKPVLVELLLAALAEKAQETAGSQPGIPLAFGTHAEIYLYATNGLLLRNIAEGRALVTVGHKIFFLCEIAWELLSSDRRAIHYSDIPSRINQYFGAAIEDRRALDGYEYDLRTQTLLGRNADGYYKFWHDSVGAFYVALKLAAELQVVPDYVRDAYTRLAGEATELPYSRLDAEHATETFGKFPLASTRMSVVLPFLVDLVDTHRASEIWELVQWTKGKSPEVVQHVGGNAATLLGRMGVDWGRVDAAGASLVGADLSCAVLSNVSMDGTDLRGATLVRARVSRRGLERALLAGTRFTVLIRCAAGESVRRHGPDDDVELARPGWLPDAVKEWRAWEDGAVSLIDATVEVDSLEELDGIGEQIRLDGKADEIAVFDSDIVAMRKGLPPELRRIPPLNPGCQGRSRTSARNDGVFLTSSE